MKLVQVRCMPHETMLLESPKRLRTLAGETLRLLGGLWAFVGVLLPAARPRSGVAPIGMGAAASLAGEAAGDTDTESSPTWKTAVSASLDRPPPTRAG